MRLKKIFGQTALLAGAMIFLTASLALAAAKPHPPAPEEPKPEDNPFLAKLMQTGAKIYYMGMHSGLRGWFIIKDNQIQMGYATADNQSVVMGVLFDQDGGNVSTSQFQDLVDNNKEVSGFIAGLNTQAPGMMPKGVAPTAAVAPPTIANAMPPTALPPGDRLVLDLQKAAGVTVGAPSAAQLLMVINPNCPHCQATWRALRDAVYKNNLQIRLIPIGSPGSDDARAAAQLLQARNVLEAWDKYVEGDKSQLAGIPEESKQSAILANDALIDSWHIQNTPYLVYRAKDGTVKVLEGEPDHIAALLGDLAR